MPSKFIHEWIAVASVADLLWLLDTTSVELDARGLRDPAARVRDARESTRQARVGQLDELLKEDRHGV